MLKAQAAELQGAKRMGEDMRSNTGEQLRDILDILPRYETTAENKPILKARVEELEALLEECRLSLCPFDCKLLLLRIDTALAKKELSE